MASNSEFWDLYNHPRWQEKRLRIMERAEFTCENCGDKEKTQNVHHTYYRKGAKPWEYEDSELKCLCKDCHKKHHEMADELKKLVNESDHLDLIIGYVKGISGLPCRLDSHEQAAGYLNAFSIPEVMYRDDGKKLYTAEAFICWLTARGYAVDGGSFETEFKPLLMSALPNYASLVIRREPTKNG